MKALGSRLSLIGHTALFYPYATLWLIAGGVLMAKTAALIDLSSALVILTGLALLVFLIGQRREVRMARAEVAEVHTLVNSQHDDLVDRVAQLIAALRHANVDVPEGKAPR